MKGVKITIAGRLGEDDGEMGAEQTGCFLAAFVQAGELANRQTAGRTLGIAWFILTYN